MNESISDSEINEGKTASALAKEYDFENDFEYFEYIEDSFINGQRQQARNLYKVLDTDGRKDFYNYAKENNLKNSIENFGDLLETEQLSEDKSYYIKEGYITHPDIKDEKTLIERIEKNINPAFADFVKKYDIPIKNPKITMDTNRRGKPIIDLEADEITDMGIFKDKVFEYVNFGFFSGREIRTTEQDGEFLFHPLIWCTLHVEWQQVSGGTNGTGYYYTTAFGQPDDSLFYDILNDKFIPRGEGPKK